MQVVNRAEIGAQDQDFSDFQIAINRFGEVAGQPFWIVSITGQLLRNIVPDRIIAGIAR